MSARSRGFGQKKKQTTNSSGRLRCMSVIFMVLGAGIVTRLFFLQVIEHSFYEALASGQHEVLRQLLPQRGEIFAETEEGLYPLVINRDQYVIYAVPQEISDAESVADTLYPWMQELAARNVPPEAEQKNEDDTAVIQTDETNTVVEILTTSEIVDGSEVAEEEIDPEYATLLATLSKADDPYEPLLKGVAKDDVEVLKSFELPGIHWIGVPSRYYPEKNIGSHTLGFFSSLSDVKKGQYGLEGFWDSALQGKQGIIRSEKDAKGSQISIAPRSLQEAHDGADLIVTIDPAIQYTACTALASGAKRFDAKSGSVVVLDPKNGAVLAMCGYPDFDPNTYNHVESIGVYAHPALSRAYEPGSIFKPITMAAGLDSGSVTPDDTYEDTGEYSIAGYTIKNSDLLAHGKQTMTEVLEYSLNTGVIHVAEKLGPKLFKKYVEAFGFGEQTGITLSGEVSGTTAQLDEKGFIYTATASFGQGVTVTPIQMATAFAAIANGGTLYKPYIVKEIHHDNGSVEIIEPTKVRQVISSKASAMLSGMLVSVVKNGHAGKAGVPGHLVAGKTGTAQVAGERGQYSDKTIHSFVGFAPVDDPRFVMIVRLDHPTAVRFSSDSAAPIFGEIADFILKYYHVPPTELNEITK